MVHECSDDRPAEALARELGLLRGKETRAMNLAVCSRSGDIIEPLVQPQWYVDCSGPAKRACDAVRSGELRILPKMHEKTWFQWLENIRPWCISRQLWWGHRIPVWYADAHGGKTFVARSEAEARKPPPARRPRIELARRTLARTGDTADALARSTLWHGTGPTQTARPSTHEARCLERELLLQLGRVWVRGPQRLRRLLNEGCELFH